MYGNMFCLNFWVEKTLQKIKGGRIKEGKIVLNVASYLNSSIFYYVPLLESDGKSVV